MSTKILYKNNPIADIAYGVAVTIPTEGLQMESNIAIVNEALILQEKTVTVNGEYTPDVGADGFSKITVNVADIPAVLQEKTANPSIADQIITPDAGFEGMSKVTITGIKLQEKIATEDGVVTADSGYDGLSKVTVSVPSEEPILQEKIATENGEVTPDSGYDGLSKVIVNVPSDEPTLEELIITENGEYTPSSDGFSKVIANVEPLLQEKTAQPSTTEYSILPDTDYDGLSKVTIEAIPSDYIIPTGTIQITENGTHDVTNYASAQINVSGEELNLQEKTATENGEVVPDAGYNGLSKVIVNVEDSPLPVEKATEADMHAALTFGETGSIYKYTGATTSEYTFGSLYMKLGEVGTKDFTEVILKSNLEEITITENGEYNPSGDGYSKVTVNVESEAPTLEEITITENGEYTPTTDGYSKVTVNVAPLPSEVATASEMHAMLTFGEVGSIYKYTGATTSEYTFGSFYIKLGEIGVKEFTEVILESNLEEVTITENGEYIPTEGYSKVTVNVLSEEPVLEELTITENGEYTPSGDGFSKVIANVEPLLQEKTISTNGEHSPDAGYQGFSKVMVNVADVPAVLQEKTVTPTSDQQEVIADTEFYGLSKVTVNAIPDTYILEADVETALAKI